MAIALVLWLPPREETRLLAAVSLTAVTPYGASAGVTVQITGTGFDPTASQNSVTFTPSSGAATTVVADAIATLDATKGLRRLSVKVPSGLAIGTAAVRVVNTTTGESAAGASIQIVALSLPDVTSGARGAQNLTVRVNGTSNMQFVAGRTTVTFGAGVTVTSTQVTSSTSLLATVTISSTTPLGARTVLVATSTQTAQLTGAFTVTGATVDAPPTANAGPDQTVAVGSTVTLNGSASTDPEGHALTFAWSFVSKPSGSQASLSDPTSVSPTFVVDRSGTYQLQLTVNDGALSSAADVVRISTLNSRPIGNAGPDQTTTVNGLVRLDGTLSSDPDGESADVRVVVSVSPRGQHADVFESGRRNADVYRGSVRRIRDSADRVRWDALEHRGYRQSIDTEFGSSRKCRDRSNVLRRKHRHAHRRRVQRRRWQLAHIQVVVHIETTNQPRNSLR